MAGLRRLDVAYLMISPAWREPLRSSPPWVDASQFVPQPAALLLTVAGFLGHNPTAVGQADPAAQPDAVRGALRIPRQSFLWGVVLLSAGHMAVASSPRSLLVFGTLLLLAHVGTRSIGRKRRRQLGDRWTDHARATSSLPFAAILAGRRPPGLREFRRRDLAIAALFALGATLAYPAFRPGQLA